MFHSKVELQLDEQSKCDVMLPSSSWCVVPSSRFGGSMKELRMASPLGMLSRTDLLLNQGVVDSRGITRVATIDDRNRSWARLVEGTLELNYDVFV